MTTKKLNIYGIHSEQYTKRAENLHGLIQQLRSTAMNKGYSVTPNLVLKPTTQNVQDAMQEHIAPKLCYDVCGDADFDNSRQNFSLEMISNFDKHVSVWKQIAESGGSDENDLFMVLEDDSYLLPNGLDVYLKLLESKFDYDILFLGICINEKTPLQVQNIRKYVKILPTKDSYLIKKGLATRLYTAFTQDPKMYKYTLRIQLSYVFQKLLTNEKVMCLSQRFLIDGSKLGVFPSTIHVNNILLFNNDFMALFRLLKGSNSIDKKTIAKYLKPLEALQSPDVYVLMGFLYEKSNDITSAVTSFEKGLKLFRMSDGIVNSRSEFLMKLISFYGKKQSDIEECKSLPSKYDLITVG